MYAWSVYKHAVVAAFCIVLWVVKMLLKEEAGDHALDSHGNYIVDHGKSWNCVFEFLWEPCENVCVRGGGGGGGGERGERFLRGL